MPKFDESKLLDTFHPDINYTNWMALDYWSLSEAALLAYGYNPDEDNINLNPYGTKMIDYPSQLPSFSQKLLRVMERSKDNIFQEQIGRVSAIKFIDWLIQRGNELPKALITAYEEKKLSAVDYKTQYMVLKKENESLKKQLQKTANQSSLAKENKSLMKILGCILKSHYAYPSRDAVGKISKRIEACGLSMDDETIRRHSDASVQHVAEESGE